MNVVEWCKYKLDPKFMAVPLSSIGSNIIDSFEMLLSWIALHSIQLSPEGEVNSGGMDIPRREASRYISSAVHHPEGELF